MQFVSQKHAVALNCLSSQRCIALLFPAEEVIKKALSLTGEIFFGGGAETPSSAWTNFLTDFRPTDTIRRRRPNSVAQGSSQDPGTPLNMPMPYADFSTPVAYPGGSASFLGG